MNELLKTPLTDWHEKNGAKMAEFAGYSMPIQYPTGALKEIHAVRNAAGIFDISHMRPIFVEGLLARNFLSFIDTRDLSTMQVGDARYGIVCLDSGEPIDDIIVYLLSGNEESERFLVIANASNGTRVYDHFRNVKRKYRTSNEEVKITDGLGKYGFISLQGPKAEEILTKAFASPIPKKYYSCTSARLYNEPVILSKTGYTGEAGFEILCPKFAAYYHWVSLLETGAPCGLMPAGLAARDTLRLEAGMPLFGHEMDKEHDPISAGLEKFVDFDKFGYFLGKTALEKVRNGTSKKPREYFHAFTMEKGRVPRHGDFVFAREDETDVSFGQLTSAGFSPTLGKNIALGYLDYEVHVGGTVFVLIGGRLYPATVTKLPFYKRAKK